MEYESFQDTSFDSIQSALSIMSCDDILNILEPEVSKMSEEPEMPEESEMLEEPEMPEKSEESEESEKSKEPVKSENFQKSQPEFPNDAYKDLMILVTKHKL